LVEGEREERSTGPLDFVLEELAIQKQHKKTMKEKTEKKKGQKRLFVLFFFSQVPFEELVRQTQRLSEASLIVLSAWFTLVINFSFGGFFVIDHLNHG